MLVLDLFTIEAAGSCALNRCVSDTAKGQRTAKAMWKRKRKRNKETDRLTARSAWESRVLSALRYGTIRERAGRIIILQINTRVCISSAYRVMTGQVNLFFPLLNLVPPPPPFLPFFTLKQKYSQKVACGCGMKTIEPALSKSISSSSCSHHHRVNVVKSWR